MSTHKDPSPVKYVRYWVDGQSKYCLLQQTGNESELEKLSKHLEELKVISKIQTGFQISQTEMTTLITYASEIYESCSGKFTLDSNYNGQDDGYVKIKKMFVGVKSTPLFQ